MASFPKLRSASLRCLLHSNQNTIVGICHIGQLQSFSYLINSPVSWCLLKSVHDLEAENLQGSQWAFVLPQIFNINLAWLVYQSYCRCILAWSVCQALHYRRAMLSDHYYLGDYENMLTLAVMLNELPLTLRECYIFATSPTECTESTSTSALLSFANAYCRR